MNCPSCRVENRAGPISRTDYNARHLTPEIGVTGWDDSARAIEA